MSEVLSSIDKHIKFGAALGFSAILRIVGYTLFGLVLNLVLLVFQWENLSYIFSKGTDYYGSYAIAIGIVVFPIMFFILGQKQAIQNALVNIVRKKKLTTVHWIFSKVCNKYPALLDKGVTTSVQITDMFENASEYLVKVPSVVVQVVRVFVSKLDLAEKFIEVSKEVSIGVDEKDEQLLKISEAVSDMIPEDMFEPNPIPTLILFVSNISLFFI